MGSGRERGRENARLTFDCLDLGKPSDGSRHSAQMLTKHMLEQQIREIIDAAEHKQNPDEIQAIASILYCVLAALHSKSEIALMNHCAVFAENLKRLLTAQNN
jgi:hypothetical protein